MTFVFAMKKECLRLVQLLVRISGPEDWPGVDDSS